jgi:hypothetical protein
MRERRERQASKLIKTVKQQDTSKGSLDTTGDILIVQTRLPSFHNNVFESLILIFLIKICSIVSGIMLDELTLFAQS